MITLVVDSSTSHASLFFFNDTATTEIYTLSLHDALPISWGSTIHYSPDPGRGTPGRCAGRSRCPSEPEIGRATSELQSQSNLVCRLLLEKKKATAILL